MQFSRHTYLTPENILFEASNNVGDRDFKKIHRGLYETFVQHCLEEFDLDTLWHDKRVNLVIDKQGSEIELPQSTFNVREAYGYCGELCEPGKMTKLWHKSDFYSEGGRVVAKNRRDGSSDPFYVNRNFQFFRAPFTEQLGRLDPLGQKMYYYNVENGVFMYSTSVREFDKVHLRLTGFTCAFGDVPLIPQFLRTAVIDYVSEAAARALMVDNPAQYTTIWKIYSQRLDKEDANSGKGSWYKARRSVARMDKGARDDYKEYMYRWTYL